MQPILYIVIPCYNEQEVLPVTAPMFLQKINDLYIDRKAWAYAVSYIGSTKEMKNLVKEMRKNNPNVDYNIYKALDNVNLNCVIGTKKDGKYGIVDITENTVLDFNYENISYIVLNIFHPFYYTPTL